MKFWVDKLPKSCAEKDCPFNYDTIACRAIDSEMGNAWYERGKALREALDGNGKRYYKCPLRLERKSGNVG